MSSRGGTSPGSRSLIRSQDRNNLSSVNKFKKDNSGKSSVQEYSGGLTLPGYNYLRPGNTIDEPRCVPYYYSGEGGVCRIAENANPNCRKFPTLVLKLLKFSNSL